MHYKPEPGDQPIGAQDMPEDREHNLKQREVEALERIAAALERMSGLQTLDGSGGTVPPPGPTPPGVGGG
jgi:hypothetical protein